MKIAKSISDIDDDKFSAITLWHVLEHLPKPGQALTELSKLLDQSGTIFIAVPNLQSFDAAYYENFWAAYDVPRHLWHFDKTNMEILLKNNGLRLTTVIPMRLDSYYVSMLSESYKHPKLPKLLQLFFAIIVGLKSNLMARKNINYSSLIYVAKR